MWKEETAWKLVKPHYWVWLFLFVAFAVPGWFSYDMFLDGLTYGAISRNWAMGEGSFWFMHYTDHLYPRFVEHPPLFFQLQGWLFYLFGDHAWIEELFNSILWLALGITALQFVEQIENEAKWVMIAMMFLLPGVCWSFQNNMLEPLLVICFLNAIHSFAKTSRNSAWVSGFWVGLACLVKGGFAVPLLLIPMLNYLHTSHKRIAGFYGTLALIGFSLWVFPDARAFWEAYIDKQIIGSLDKGWDVGALAQRLLLLSGPWIVIGLGVQLGIRKAWFSFRITPKGRLLFLVAVLYSLPWFFTSRFNPHYFMVSHVLLWIAVVQSLQVRTVGLPSWTSVLALVLVLVTSFVIQPNERDSVRLAHELQRESNQDVPVSPQLCDDWYLYAAVMRITKKSIRCTSEEQAMIVSNENECLTPQKIGKYYLCKNED